MRLRPTSPQQRSCETCPGPGQPNLALNGPKRPVSVMAPIARFHPPLVDTSAQPSITRQLRNVQGKIVSSATSAATAPNSTFLRQLPRKIASNHGPASNAGGRTKVPKPSTKPDSTAPNLPPREYKAA